MTAWATCINNPTPLKYKATGMVNFVNQYRKSVGSSPNDYSITFSSAGKTITRVFEQVF